MAVQTITFNDPFFHIQEDYMIKHHYVFILQPLHAVNTNLDTLNNHNLWPQNCGLILHHVKFLRYVFYQLITAKLWFLVLCCFHLSASWMKGLVLH